MPLGIRCFRYPRSVDSIFIMPSIGANFFGKARGACGNLLEKQFPLFLYALFLLSKCLSSFFTRFNRAHRCPLLFKSEIPSAFSYLSYIHMLIEKKVKSFRTFLSTSFFWPIDYFQQQLRCLGHRIFGRDDMKRT